MAEFGKVHRYEPSGALHGLMRVSTLLRTTHTSTALTSKWSRRHQVVELILDIYRDFGFENVVIKLSTRPEKRIGSDEIWDKLRALTGPSARWVSTTFCTPERELSMDQIGVCSDRCHRP